MPESKRARRIYKQLIRQSGDSAYVSDKVRREWNDVPRALRTKGNREKRLQRRLPAYKVGQRSGKLRPWKSK